MLTSIKTPKVTNTIRKKLFIYLPRAMNMRGAGQPVIDRLIKPGLDNRPSPFVNFVSVRHTLISLKLIVDYNFLYY